LDIDVKKHKELPFQRKLIGPPHLSDKKSQLYDVYQQRSTCPTPHKNNQWEKTK